ncbi:MAG: phospholipid carrier-dependent glycosyltransferase, partial [Candidatus Schekmanbacteria bacterium]
MNKNKFQQNRYRIFIALFIFAITFSIVFITEKDIGITWDEIYLNDDAARIYVEWIKEAYKGILSGNFDFLSKTVIDKYFGAISDGGRINWHPPFARIIGGISWKFFTPYLGEMKAYRLPSALFFSLEAMLIFLILSRFFSISAGLLSVFSFILMPRVFAHSHIFALDTPVSAMWLLTIYAFIKGLDDEKWAIFTGFIFGLALSTKIHSALIPLSIAIWFLMTRNKRIWKNILSITLFSLPTFILSWPWLWYDTFARIFSFEDDQIGDLTSNFKVTYYLGKSLASSMPWHYVSVMFLSTIPPLILLAFFYGIYITVKKNLNFINGENKERKEKWDIALLLLSNAVIMLAVASAPGIPKYDGVRLFLPAFPFTASIAGIGFHYIIKNFFKKEWLKYLAGLLYIVFPLISLIRVHPYELSYYNILVGGIEGAKKIGLETTYWGDAFNRDFLKVIEKKYSTKKILYCGLPQKKRQLKFYYRNGLVAKSILDNATCSSDAFKNEGYYDYLVLNCRQGVFKKLEWFYYNFLKPEYNTILDGVPLISIYKSPF